MVVNRISPVDDSCFAKLARGRRMRRVVKKVKEESKRVLQLNWGRKFAIDSVFFTL